MSEPVVSDPAADASAPPSLSSLSAAERASWRLTGEFPSTTEPTLSTEADSSPAEPDVQAASTEATPSPASEPGTPKKKANAETRKTELQAEIEALVARRNALKSEVESPAAVRSSPAPDVRAASSPAPESLSQIIAKPDVNSPVMDDETFFQKFPEAKLGDFNRYTARYEIASAQRDQARASTLDGRTRTYLEIVKQEFPEGDAFWNEKVVPIAQALVPLDLMSGGQPTALNYLAQEIYTSPQAGKILRHLAEHPEVLQSMQVATARDAIRTVARIETLVSETPVPRQPVVKTTTSAPDLPETLGRKPSAPTDEVGAAIAAGDVRRYMAAQNRREMAS